MSGAALTSTGGKPENEADALDLLTEAIVSYCEEIDECRRICLQHERTTVVYATPCALHLVQLFPWKEKTLAHLRLSVERLPQWDTSPFWKSEKSSWTTLLRNIGKRAIPGARHPLLARGIAWEGRPVLVCASSVQGESLLRLELLLPPILADVPELPLRVVASGLFCLESLLPERVAAAVPAAAVPQGRSLPLLEYLRRTMPQNLYASQCFSLGGAEK